MASGMESKGERKGGGSLTAICKLHFSCMGKWVQLSKTEQLWEQDSEKSGKLAGAKSVKENRKRWKRGALDLKGGLSYSTPSPWLLDFLSSLSPTVPPSLPRPVTGAWLRDSVEKPLPLAPHASSHPCHHLLPHKPGAHSQVTANNCYIFLHLFPGKGQSGTRKS